jgi:NitT/TauT family transport system permease protein
VHGEQINRHCQPDQWLGAIISQATDSGNYRLLLAATLMMAVMVVTINRLVWRPLYTLASARFKLEA